MNSELAPAQKRAWIAFFVAHGRLTKRIDEDLAAANCVSLDVYDVLLALEEAPDHRMRMSDLAEKVLFSRSGVTRLVDRLEKLGYIRRVRCPMDRRACHAMLTPEGLAAREAAWPVYRKAIADYFAVHVNEEEAAVIADVFRRMVKDPLWPVPDEPCAATVTA